MEPSNTSRTLGDWPLAFIRVRCRKCPNIRFYMTAHVRRRYGPDQLMPDLPAMLMDCDRRSYASYCGAYFSDALAIEEWRNGTLKLDWTPAYPRGAGRG